MPFWKFTLVYTRKLQNNQERTMISYAKYKPKTFYSGIFHKILNSSGWFQNLLKASFDMKKKVTENSGFFSKVPEASMI